MHIINPPDFCLENKAGSVLSVCKRKSAHFCIFQKRLSPFSFAVRLYSEKRKQGCENGFQQLTVYFNLHADIFHRLLSHSRKVQKCSPACGKSCFLPCRDYKHPCPLRFVCCQHCCGFSRRYLYGKTAEVQKSDFILYHHFSFALSLHIQIRKFCPQ